MRRLDKMRVARHWAPSAADEADDIAGLIGSILVRFVQGCRTAAKPAKERARRRETGDAP
jgi:hypothetical protein